MYKLQPEFCGQPSSMVLRCVDNAFIPFDEGNSDYQAYLAWLAEGNAPLPAEEPQ
jgi:hypothetical protein